MAKRGRPTLPKEERLGQISIRVSSKLLERIDTLSRQDGIKRGPWITASLEKYVAYLEHLRKNQKYGDNVFGGFHPEVVAKVAEDSPTADSS